MPKSLEQLDESQLMLLDKYHTKGLDSLSEKELFGLEDISPSLLNLKQTSGTAAAGKEAVESLLPTAGGIGGMVGAVTLGAPLIGAATAVNPILGAATGLGVGLAGGFGGSALVNEAQNKVMSYVPESFKESMGFGKEQRALEQEQHPDLSFAGGLAPGLLAFRPGTVAPLLDKAGKVIASANTQRAVMAGLGSGIEAGSELVQKGELNPKHVLMAGAFQGVAATPTKLIKKVFPSFNTEGATTEKPTNKAEDVLAEMRAKKAAAAETAKTTPEEPIVPPLTEGEGAFDSMRKSLGGDEPVKDVSPSPAFDRMAEDLKNPVSSEARNAQQVLEERQAALEQDVHTQATRDLSVAERARQEQAGWPTTHTDTTPSISTEPSHPVIAAAEKKLEAAQEHVLAVQEKVANGDASPVVLKQAQAAAAKAEVTVTKAKVNLNKAPAKLKGQRGALFIGENKPEPKINFAKKAETDQVNKTLGDLLPEFSRDARTPEEVIALAANSPDVPERLIFGNKSTASRLAGKAIGQHTKGMQFETLRSDNVIQKYAKFELSDGVDAATLRSKQLIDDTLAPAWRDLSTKEKIELQQTLQGASKENMDISPEMLRKHGFSEKQITAAKALTEIVHPANLESMNKARLAAGKAEIPRYMGYMIGMADGNFRTALIRDKMTPDGKLIVDEKGTPIPEVVGIVGSDFRWIMEDRVAKMLKANPEWKAGEEKYNGIHNKGNRGDSLQEALMLISDNNPNFAEFAAAMDVVLTNETYHSFGAVKHTKGKKGVIGMQGDQPWLEGERNWYGTRKTAEQAAKENAEDFINAHVRGTQMMSKWGALSEAVSKINKVLNDPSIQQTQKRAIKSVRDYIDTTMGKNPSAMGQVIDNWIGVVGDTVGIGPAAFSKTGSVGRSIVNNEFFTLNPIYYATQLLQPSLGTPIVKSFMKSRGIDVSMDPTAITDLASSAALSAFMSKMKSDTVMSSKVIPKSLRAIYEQDRAMWKYGDEHGMSSSQIVLGSPHTNKDFGYYKDAYFDRPIGSTIEGIPRAVTYATMTHMLRKAGFENDPQLFPMARQLTDLVMGDYRHHEQAKIHQNLGMVGNVSRNLTSYPLHQKGLVSLLAREALKSGGSWKPFGTFLLAGLVYHGVQGTMGYKDADTLVTAISPLVGKPTTLDRLVLDGADAFNKEHGTKVGDALAMGAASFAGINLSGNLGQSSFVLGMSGGMSKAVDIGESVYNFAKDRSGWNAKMLAKEAGGAPARIAMANMGVTTHTNPKGETLLLNKKGETDVKLTPEDVTALKIGSRGTHASKVAAQDYSNTLATKYYQGKQTNILEKITQENANTHGKISPKFLKEMASDYVEHQGTPENFVKFVDANRIALNTSLREELLMRNSSGSLSGAYKLQRGYNK